MRLLLPLTLALSLAAAARAQPAPPPPLEPTASTPEPLAPEVEVPVVVPPKAADALLPDAKKGAVPPPDARAQEGCGLVPAGLGSLAGFGGGFAVGGLMFCIGGVMASIDPEGGSSDNCAQACLQAAAAVFVIAIGVVIAVGGILALGPIAAIAGTIGAALGSAGAGRKVWPSVAGGSLGIVLSLAGIAIALYGVTDSPTIPFIGGTPFDQGDPKHVAMVGGVGLSAASGLVAVGGALIADAVWGGPDVDFP